MLALMLALHGVVITVVVLVLLVLVCMCVACCGGDVDVYVAYVGVVVVGY